jgi:hypothetical protein
MNHSSYSWKTLTTVLISVLLTLLIIDFCLSSMVAIPKKSEVYDSIEGLERGNPDVLVLSSSHGRTFQFLGKELLRRSNGGVNLVAIPVEGGVLEAYEWVLEHRIKPFVDERRPDGRLVRDRLKRFIVATDYWDTCPNEVRVNPPEFKISPRVIPRVAWEAKHYLADVTQNGMNPKNRDYVRRLWADAFEFSTLSRNRFNGRSELERWFKALLRGEKGKYTGWFSPLEMRDWQETLEEMGECAGRPDRARIYQQFIDFAHSRGLELTFVLFPKFPETITPLAHQTTIASYRKLIDTVTHGKKVRVVDLFFSVPLDHRHFEADLDHLDQAGNRLFTDWTLSNDLAFLLAPIDSPPHTSAHIQ